MVSVISLNSLAIGLLWVRNRVSSVSGRKGNVCPIQEKENQRLGEGAVFSLHQKSAGHDVCSYEMSIDAIEGAEERLDLGVRTTHEIFRGGGANGGLAPT